MSLKPVFKIDMFKIRIILILVLFNFSFNLNAQNSRNILKLIEHENYTQALSIIDQKLINNTNNRELLYFKAQTELKLKYKDKAIKTYQLIIQLYPLFPEAYNNLAGIYATQGNLELAKETLEKGMNTNKSYALLHNNINSIYLEMARESYIKALRLGVKKHNVQLSVANLDSDIKSSYKQPSTSPILVSHNNINKSKKIQPIINNKVILDEPVRSKQVVKSKKAIGPKNTVPRVVKKKIIVKAWNEPIISVKDEVITALQGWAAAWSAQDINLYLSFYNTQFLPENGIAKKVWASQRQSRLLKPRWIEVRLSNFLFEKQEDDQAVVSVIQMYRSNNFRDKSKKKFLLKRSDDGWQILNEINL